MRIRLIAMGATLLVLSGSAFAASFWNLGAGVTTTGMAPDGSAVVYNTATNTYIWSASQGAKDLGAGYLSVGVAKKTDGSYVIGSNAGAVAYRWDGNLAGTGTWTQLPLASGVNNWYVKSTAAGSAGVFIGGYAGTPTWAACRYKESANSVAQLSLPSGTHSASYIYGISSTGWYAGQAQYGGTGSGGGSRQAMGSSSTGALVLLNNLQGAPTTSNSASGTVIADNGTRMAGWSSTGVTSQQKACYWNLPAVTGTAPTAIPFITGHDYSRSTAISADGSKICGYSQLLSAGSSSMTCWIWDSVNGSRDLYTYMTGYGVDMTGWQLTYIYGVSNDGKWIVGNGKKDGVASGFVFYVPEPSSFAALAFGLLPLLRFRRRK